MYVCLIFSPAPPILVANEGFLHEQNNISRQQNTNSSPVTPIAANIEPIPPRPAPNVLRLMNNFEDRINVQLEEQSRRHQQVERELREEVEELKEEIKRGKKKQFSNRVKVPPAISSSVRHAYAILSTENGWNFAEKLTTATNERVNRAIKVALLDGGIDCEEKVIRRAISRYFESQKRKHKLVDQPPEVYLLKASENRKSTRRHRLFKQRDKILKQGEDLELWDSMTIWDMSDVETDEESVIKHRTLPWRPFAQNDLVKRCDEILQVLRTYGHQSQRLQRDPLM